METETQAELTARTIHALRVAAQAKFNVDGLPRYLYVVRPIRSAR